MEGGDGHKNLHSGRAQFEGLRAIQAVWSSRRLYMWVCQHDGEVPVSGWGLRSARSNPGSPLTSPVTWTVSSSLERGSQYHLHCGLVVLIV